LTLPNHNSSAIVVGEAKLIVDMNIANNGRENGNIYNQEGLSPTLLARDYKDPKKVNVSETIVYDDYNSTIRKDQDTIGTLTTNIGNDAPRNGYKVIEYSDYSLEKIKGNMVDENGLVGTITANAMQSLNHDNCHIVKHNLRIRKLTPKECYRLMGFGDQAFDLAQPNQSNSSLYHQAGDSIVVNVLMGLFRSLL
jgi:DNA (cytosine-5)-methyltransferase 1